MSHPHPHNFVDPNIKPYSAQLQECSEKCKFELDWKYNLRKVDGRDVHEWYPIVNRTPYPQYRATDYGKQAAKNAAAGLIISNGTRFLKGPT